MSLNLRTLNYQQLFALLLSSLIVGVLNAQLIVNGDTLTEEFQKLSNPLYLSMPSSIGENRVQDRIKILPGIQETLQRSEYPLAALGIGGINGSLTLDNAPILNLNNTTVYYDLVEDWTVDFTQSRHYLNNGIGVHNQLSYLSKVDTLSVFASINSVGAQVSAAVPLGEKWSVLLAGSHNYSRLISNEYVSYTDVSQMNAETLFKLNFHPNKKHHVSFTSSYDFDKDSIIGSPYLFQDMEDVSHQWVNILNWKYEITKKLKLKAGLSHAADLRTIDYEKLNYSEKRIKQWQTFTAFSELEYNFRPGHKVMLGFNINHMAFPTAKQSNRFPISTTSTETVYIESKPNSFRSNVLYLGHEWKAYKLLTIDYGLKFWDYFKIAPIDTRGPDTLFSSYASEYKSRFLPWANIHFKVAKHSLLSFQYASGANTISRFQSNPDHPHTFTRDRVAYLPSTPSLKPTLSQELLLVFRQRIKMLNLSVSAFQFQITNQHLYEPPLPYIYNRIYPSIYNVFLARTFSRGTTLTLSKSEGRLAGWVSYTFLLAERTSRSWIYNAQASKTPESIYKQHVSGFISLNDIKNWNLTLFSELGSGLMNNDELLYRGNLTLNRFLISKKWTHLLSAGVSASNELYSDVFAHLNYTFKFSGK